MQVVQVFVAPDGIHVGVQSVAGRDAVGGELHPFPFGERVDHFGHAVAHTMDRESDGAFDTVQVIIDTCAREDEQGSRHAAQVKRLRQLLLEGGFQHAYSLFRCLRRQRLLVIFRNDK